ncbi:MAG: LptF/LptG family permease [Myxococcota bacterium]
MVAPRILWRYILRDVLLYTLLGLFVFTLLLVVQNTLRFLEDLLAAGVGLSGLMELMGVILPTYLSYAIPTSLLLGVLLAFGRMSADGEIIAMRASGISVPRLLPPVLALGAIAATLTAYLLFELEPRSYERMKHLVREMASSVKLAEPGRFRSLGKRTLYVHDLGDETCPLSGVLIGDFSDPRRTLYIAARCGIISDGPTAESVGVKLIDGSVHFSESGSERYRRIRFVEMRTSIDLSGYIDRGTRARELTMPALLDLRRRARQGEPIRLRDREGRTAIELQIHRRVAFPFACVLLTLLSVPLGIRPLRSGRSAGALTAVGLMGLYWLLFTAGELAGERHWLPTWLGMWAANALVLVLALVLMRRSIRGDS